MLAKLQRMAIDFLNVLQAAHRSFLEGGLLDTLPQPTRTGSRAGRHRSPESAHAHSYRSRSRSGPKPGGFTAKELARKVNEFSGTASTFSPRQAAYDLSKLRGKSIIERVAHTRNYTLNAAGIRALAGLLILREKVIRPVLAGICKTRLGRPPKIIHPIDIHSRTFGARCTSLSGTSHLPPETTRQHAVVKSPQAPRDFNKNRAQINGSMTR